MFYVLFLDALIAMLMVLVSTVALVSPCKMGLANLTRVYVNCLALTVVHLGSVSIAFPLPTILLQSTELVYFARFHSVLSVLQKTLQLAPFVPKDST